MGNKYYTPEIEEFNVGFEYERIVSGMEYGKTIYDGFYSIRAYDWDTSIEEDIKDGEIRVKYLDKEDIESLGWKFIKQHPGTTNFDFEKGECSLNFDPEFGNKWNLRIYDGEDQDSEFNYFSGYIKNKSELIKLLKQLSINE